MMAQQVPQFGSPACRDVLRRLRNADPETYDFLLRIMDAYVYEVTVAVIEAPPDHVYGAQGRAQQARAMFQKFVDVLRPEPTPQQ
jgi:hypothetical protein